MRSLNDSLYELYVHSHMYTLFNKNLSRQNYLDLRPSCNWRRSLIIRSFLVFVLRDFLCRHLLQTVFARHA